MKIIITGCLGFIGSHFTRYCLEKGHEVLGIDCGTYAANFDLSSEFLDYKNFSFKGKDINDLTCDEIGGWNFLINFAAESHVDNSITNSTDFIESNISGVCNILDCLKLIPKDARPFFIQISTDEVYGDSYHKSTPGSTLHPSNPYAATKASADMLVKAWSRTYDIDYFIVRMTNNYGPGQHKEKLIPKTFHCFTRDLKLPLHNKGKPIRDWLHVLDTCDGIYKLLSVTEEYKNTIWHFAGGDERRNIDTVYIIMNAIFPGSCVSKKTLVESSFWLDFSYSRPGQDKRYRISDKKTRDALGWKPKRNFEEEIQKMAEEYKNG